MNFIRRIYVEKKTNANVESKSILNDLKYNLGISSLENVRLLNCYDIEGISDQTYEKCLSTVFTEPPVDILYEEKIEYGENDFVFSVKYLPGQFDQRADSAMQAIQILLEENSEENPIVESSKVYVLQGEFSKEEKQKIKDYMINPVDSSEVPLEKPEKLMQEAKEPADVKIIEGFIGFNDSELSDFLKEAGLAMSGADLKHCQEYFENEEKRNPTISEIKVLDTYWSDHCRHTTFLTEIEQVEIEEGTYSAPIKRAYDLYISEKNTINADRPVTLMNIAQMGMKALRKKGLLNDLDESEEINACSIVAEIMVDGKPEEWLIMFKNETHNHPTEIEPFGGAATCLGGAIRDPLSGRSYVYQAMRVTGSGDPRTKVEDTLEGKLPQRKITTGAASGYSSYGNQIGLATGLVDEIYHEGYVAKRMEIGAVMGAAKKEYVVREVPAPGDVVILVGGRTGRDGCGGATGSSKEHTEESILTSGAEVQKGNPTVERKLQRLFRNPEVSKMIKRCNDFGAGGVSVAIGELADGLNIDLSLVPKKYDGLDGTELAISESQERMAVVVTKDDAEKFITFSQNENLEATAVAEVTEEKRLVMKWRGKEIINISRAFLDTNGASQYTKVVVTAPKARVNTTEEKDIDEKFLDNLKDLNVCGKKGLVERFDSTIGAGTVLMPFGGKHQLTPIMAMAAKVPVLEGETNAATLMSFGFDPELSSWSPFHGAVCAVVDSITKIVASGGNPEKVRLTFQEYFEKLGNDSKRWGKPFSALLGAFEAQIQMGAPSIGGKDSMSGSFKELDVPPTLVSFAVNVTEADNIISPEFKKAGNEIAVLYSFFDEEGMPDFEYLNRLNKSVYQLIKDKKIVSAHNIGFGGIGASLAKMAFGNGLGFEIEYDDTDLLFVPNYGGYVVEIDSEADVDEVLAGLEYEIIGNTTASKDFFINDVRIKHEDALKAWLEPLEGIFPTKVYDCDKSTAAINLYSAEEKKFAVNKVAKPKIFIPVFPGTNCEYDMAKAFEKAGAETETIVVKNLTTKDLQETIDAMAQAVQNSQIIAIPGGFSAGDEPDGSGKFIANVFRNPKLKDAVMELLNNKDGLMIGICNGFQALIKLGLVPYGEIRDLDEQSPTLTFNEIGRHISCVANTKVISNKSPWLYGAQLGETYQVAVSHGEGRFAASEAVIKELEANGQIATQYVDLDGNGTYDIRYNPNGSFYGVEGITSPDGRVFGKMGHCERLSQGTYKNVLSNMDIKIFESGVKYYR